MAKPTLTVKAGRPKNFLEREAEALCFTPALNIRDYSLSNIYIDGISNCVMLDPQWKPDNYQWEVEDYQKSPSTSTNWIAAKDSLGQGGYSVGWAGDINTPWYMFLTTNNLIAENRGERIDFLWHRPSSDTAIPALEIFPRSDLSKSGTIGSLTYYFTPFAITIDKQGTLRIYEYPYDTYAEFETDPSTMLTEVYSTPLTIDPLQVASRWISIWMQPLSPNDVLIKSNILPNGGFVFRSAHDRTNIDMFPEGTTGLRSKYGGLSFCNFVPVEFPTSGTITSDFCWKLKADTVYPTVKVFGWGTSGLLENETVPAEGIGGISYRLLDENGVEIPATDTPEFRKFKYEVTLTSASNRSPILSSIIFDFAESQGTDDETEVDISADVISITESSSEEFGSYKATIKVRNQAGKYNTLLQRPMLEVDYDIDGVDRAVLFTLNPSYDWYSTPTEPALILTWECGDGFEDLNRQVIGKHPAYDGMLLSDALTKFLNREGWPATLLDIDETTGIYLPKKNTLDNEYQFKPQIGSIAADFIKTLQEWFKGDWICRFKADGTFEFKEVASVEASRVFYRTSTAAAVAGTPGYYIYPSAQVELLHDQFYNEIWVVGMDTRCGKPIFALYRNDASQNDINSPDYIGRRRLMIVFTKINTSDALAWVCQELKKFYGKLRRRVTFKSKLDKALRPADFIQIQGMSYLWKVLNIDVDTSPQTMTGEGNIAGMTITAIQWPQEV